LDSLRTDEKLMPPSITIEVFFKGTDEELAFYLGDGNEKGEIASGITLTIGFNEKFTEEYNAFISLLNVKTLPIEYYSAKWTTFARKDITPRTIPMKSSLIDSSNYRYQNGSDVYIARIIRNNLQQEDIINIAQAHRKMRENFMNDDCIKSINEKINREASLTDKEVKISVELGTKTAWENSLITELNDIPFNFIGKGTQCIIKTELALSNTRTREAGIILIEEPESHLSYSNLSVLISCIKEKYAGKQIIMTTHSSFVANKLGLDKLILINDSNIAKFDDVTEGTKRFFEKIAGYDTLRFLLCKKAILVEGDSDELVVQKAFMSKNDGLLPIERGIDVISVGVAFLRFLELSDILHKRTVVITDNDGKPEVIESKYSSYLGDNKKEYIDICYDKTVDTGDLMIGDSKYNYNTLEPKMLKVNSLEKLNKIFGTTYENEDDLRKYMKHNKTECGLAIFDTEEEVEFPEYILEAIYEK
jgi:putative ATP-dependent endonuclease of OLD family